LAAAPQQKAPRAVPIGDSNWRQGLCLQPLGALHGSCSAWQLLGHQKPLGTMHYL
jgi:hypothetical protein